MTADLSALIARLEAAEVGSRELDHLIFMHTAPMEVASHWSPGDRMTFFTTSLDAALALAERLGLDVWHIMYAALMNWKAHDPRGPASRIMPLALCIAILRAKQGEGE